MTAAWQGLEDRVRANTETEEQPDLDAAIRDKERSKSIVLNPSELILWVVASERLDEFIRWARRIRLPFQGLRFLPEAPPHKFRYVITNHTIFGCNLLLKSHKVLDPRTT